MEMKIEKHIYMAAAVVAAMTATASAQYDQDISVEGRYVPEYVSRERLGVWPERIRPEVKHYGLEYSLSGVDAAFVPHAVPTVATGWNDTRLWDTSRGYLNAGLGSWLQATLGAGYRIIDTKNSLLGVRLQYNSTSLWEPDLAQSVSHTKMQRYDGTVGVFGSHDFGSGKLLASADYHLGYFNYYGFNPLPDLQVGSKQNINAPTQTLNDVSVKVGWESDRTSKVRWHAGLGARYFGMRRFYLPSESDRVVPDAYSGGRETDLSLRAGLEGNVSTSSVLGADVEGHMLSYGDYDPAGDAVLPEMPAPDTYGNMAVTPYYGYMAGNFSLRLGVRMDMAMNARDAADLRYRTFNVAPDVRLEYCGGAFALGLYAVGGNELHTLAGNYDIDYYMTPAIFSTKPAYSPVDAKLKFRFGSFSGFHVGAHLGYKVTFGQRYYGWYETILNQESPMYAKGADYRLRGISVGAEMGCDTGRYFRFDAAGTYQPQSGKNGYFNGMDRPRWTATASVQTNPWSTLKFKLGFEFRGVRSFPLMAAEVDPWTGDVLQSKIVMHRLPHYVSLNLGVSYDVTKSVGIWVRGDNLTCRRNILEPGLPEPGIRVMGGVDLKF